MPMTIYFSLLINLNFSNYFSGIIDLFQPYTLLSEVPNISGDFEKGTQILELDPSFIKTFQI